MSIYSERHHHFIFHRFFVHYLECASISKPSKQKSLKIPSLYCGLFLPRHAKYIDATKVEAFILHEYSKYVNYIDLD